MKKVLIVGANFSNKGAQSMLFTTVSEIREINADCIIYFATSKEYDNWNCLFNELCYTDRSKKIALERHPFLTIAESSIKDSIKFVIGRRNEFLWDFMDLKHVLPNLDLIIDVSGYSIGDKWPIKIQEYFLDGIRLAKRYGIPMILMPQSYGPFTYDTEKKFLLEEISDLFTYPDIIFARERTGYNSLKQKFHLSNVRLSPDLVLQNSGIILQFVFKNPPIIKTPIIKDKAVAIVPNKQCFVHGNKKEILNCYTDIINLLLSNNKEVYIFRHSREDLIICQWIYEVFQDNKNVHMLENDFSCLEYNELIKKFDFIVCSRYHGIVHAYRNGIPVIILGWAEKYQELAELVNQNEYVFDITNENIPMEAIKNAVLKMLKNKLTESKLIEDYVSEIQKSSCFSVLNKYLL